jgi:serine/threonine protein phosphatase PrpC
MELHYDVVYEKGVNAENEDAFVVNQNANVFSVIDGATGLGSLSGKMAAEIIKGTFEHENMNQSLVKIIDIGNKKIGQLVLEKLQTNDFHLIPKENRSACGIAAIKITKTRLEYVHAGDCMIFVEYENKEVRQITYDHVAKLDGVVINLFKETFVSKLDHRTDPNKWNNDKISHFLKETKAEILPKIIENRRKLNTPSGYSILDGSPEALEYLDYGELSLQDAKRILLLSDGLQLPINKATGQDAWLKTAEFAFKYGLKALIDEVNHLESTDQACYNYPRLKFADDKTGILIDLQTLAS